MLDIGNSLRKVAQAPQRLNSNASDEEKGQSMAGAGQGLPQALRLRVDSIAAKANSEGGKIDGIKRLKTCGVVSRSACAAARNERRN